jgi:integrase/recombinase XerD
VKIAQCVENFVARKRVCGYEYDSSARILRRFAAFVGKIDIALVSEEHINLFLTRGHLAHHIWRSYRSLIRRFLAYWFARRQITRIPEAEQKPNIGTRFFPYIYSKAEIARLLAAAPICQVRRRCAIGSSTLSTIVLFLYGTGLRVTEALSLTDSNQDGWSYEKMLPMLTAYMGNVREKGFLRYFELTPSRYRAQLACLDVRTRAPESIRPSYLIVPE